MTTYTITDTTTGTTATIETDAIAATVIGWCPDAPADVITRYADQAHFVQQDNQPADEPAETVDEVSDTNDDRGRHGSREVTITKVELLNAQGEDVREVRTGDAVRLRMRYRCTKPVESPVFGFTFEHDSGFLVWGHNNEYPEQLMPTLVPGEGSIDMVIPALLLRPGRRWPRRVLQIGLGAASLTRFLYRHRPRAPLTVVEIEPAVVAAARQFFKLPEDPQRLAIDIAAADREVGGRDLGDEITVAAVEQPPDNPRQSDVDRFEHPRGNTLVQPERVEPGGEVRPISR